MDRPKILTLARNTVAMLHDRMQKAELRGEHGLAAEYAAAIREERPAVEFLLAVRVSLPKRRVA